MDIMDLSTSFGSLLGFSSEELRFLESARQGGIAQRSALRQAMLIAQTNSSAALPMLDKKSPKEDPSGPVDISLIGILISVLPIVFLVGMSAFLRLGMQKKLAIASIRCAAQLCLLGFILVPIFVANKWWLTGVYTMIMLLVAAAEAVSRPAQAYDGMLFEVLLAMGVACGATITFGLILVVQVTPWYDAQYLIPMLGMLLGNSCSSVAVGLSAALEELSSGRDKVESLLVLGATRIEATREVVVRAVRLALTPLLNSMNVVGIVSIPGMMTGQILGGSDPAVAARYQIIIYFLVALSSSASAVATIYAAVLTLCDSKHRLRAEKLQVRISRTSGALVWIADQVKQGWRVVIEKIAAGGRRVRRAFQSRPAARTRHQFSRYRQSTGEAAVEEGRGIDLQQPLLGSDTA